MSKTVLYAYECEDGDNAPYWEVYDNLITAPPDIFTEDEFGDWLNGYGRRFDVRIFTLASYYEMFG